MGLDFALEGYKKREEGSFGACLFLWDLGHSVFRGC